MKDKTKKILLAILGGVVSITVALAELGGEIGVIAGIIGTVAATISGAIVEYNDMKQKKTPDNENIIDMEEGE